ncbi:Endoribonuclease YbeY [Verrucomicrobia bacterium]|nr:Endoribonuclease YbeY [Verrucomicrobiota bacterium]
MSGELNLQNRHSVRRLDLSLLRTIVQAVLQELFPGVEDYELGIYLVSESEITRLNEQFLRHPGPTDVLTFDYREAGKGAETVRAEIFVCTDEAATHSRRFHTRWPGEVVRYVVHGLLHLRGYDDQLLPMRRAMQRAESRLLRRLARQFDFNQLARQGNK